MNEKNQNSTGRKDLCNKVTLLEKLDRSLETNARGDDDVCVDLLLCNTDKRPIFRSLNNDRFSAIDLNKEAPGARTLWGGGQADALIGALIYE